jgi:solute carrier family 25 phosphate transporter 23/24/25/41
VTTSYEDSNPEGTPSASQTGIIGETVVLVEEDGDSGLTKVRLITSDRNGLMADIGSAFGSLGMSVQYAEMKSGPDGFVENSFVVSGPDCGPIPASMWDTVKSRLKASCSKRGRGRPWQERESRLRELFSRIDTMETGYIAQEDLDMFAQSLRMPRAFVHDFVDEGETSGDGRMSFEEFAAFVRSKEISLRASFDSLEPDAKGRITGDRLKKNLKNMEIRAGRYNSRKRIRRKGVEKMLRHVDDEAVLTASDFRDMMILIPSGQLQTVSPYYMKVGLDMVGWKPGSREPGLSGFRVEGLLGSRV